MFLWDWGIHVYLYLDDFFMRSVLASEWDNDFVSDQSGDRRQPRKTQLFPTPSALGYSIKNLTTACISKNRGNKEPCQIALTCANSSSSQESHGCRHRSRIILVGTSAIFEGNSCEVMESLPGCFFLNEHLHDFNRVKLCGHALLQQ